MTPSRRSLITGLVSLVAAPAIVRASSLMPVRTFDVEYVDPKVLQAFWTNPLVLPASPMRYRAELHDAIVALTLTPYPGWQFRADEAGVLFHEPVPA